MRNENDFSQTSKKQLKMFYPGRIITQQLYKIRLQEMEMKNNQSHFHYLCVWCTDNRTGLQPVSRPVEQIFGFFMKVLMQKMEPKCVQKFFKKLTAP